MLEILDSVAQPSSVAFAFGTLAEHYTEDWEDFQFRCHPSVIQRYKMIQKYGVFDKIPSIPLPESFDITVKQIIKAGDANQSTIVAICVMVCFVVVVASTLGR